MTDIDLDAISIVLAPLDLDPVFQVPSGDILTGLTGLEPEVDVRGVHSSAFGASMGPGRSTASLDVELLDHGMVVRLSSLSARRFADRILAGDPDTLEEVHAPFAFHGAARLEELRGIVAPLLGRDTVRAMRKRGDDALAIAGRDVSKRARGLLVALRWFLSGLHLAETGEIRPALADLAKWVGEAWIRDLADRPGTAALGGSPGKIGFWLQETEAVRARLLDAESRIPARNPDVIRGGLEEWCVRWGPAPSAT